MRCTSPMTVGFQADGKTLSWSQKNYSKEFATFQLPCGKCLECRLEYSKQWAVRCVHEAQMHEKNCFITLTYSDENLTSNKLIYSDFQKFMKKLRKLQNEPIGFFVTGEYGDKTKRPHWHALVFNWEPGDKKHKYTSKRGDRVYESATLTKLWGKGIAEFGTITFESAAYCARYAAKKLAHGKDNEHDFEPISKKSSKHAIGKKWLEKYWPDVFNHGRIILPNGRSTSIPRYYERWFRKNHPKSWASYIAGRKADIIKNSSNHSKKNFQDWLKQSLARDPSRPRKLTLEEVKRLITESKFKLLQANLKL